MFKLPPLPYSYDALEPYIDKKTMTIHHTKHHQAYVDNLTKALEGHGDLQQKTIEELLKDSDSLPSDIKQAVINNGGGHLNHSIFWELMTPEKNEPQGKLLEAINSLFGSVEKFKEEFTKKAMAVFGSGWAWLVIKDGKLELTRNSFQNAPVMKGEHPVLGIDLWEHAYYLQYMWEKAKYIDAWWNVVNWAEAEKRFSAQII